MAKLDKLLAQQEAIAKQIAAAKAAEKRLKSLTRRLVKRPDILSFSDDQILDALGKLVSAEKSPAQPDPQPDATE
jgi:hypothetical protein